MWQSENIKDENLKQEYRQIIKKAKKKSDSIVYLYIQLCFAAVMVVFSVMIKGGNRQLFSYIKEDYSRFFETENYMENTFSFNSFMDKMNIELQTRFNQLVTVFNSKGSRDIIPANASTKKYISEIKGKKVAEGYISSPYGLRVNPFNSKEKEFHTGLDIAAPKGIFIYAAFSGVVTHSEKSSVAGNYIRIQSDDGISTMYAHNQFNLVKTGDKVMAGQVIATMGRTGRATGPHVHFEFLSDGVRYNPVYAIEI